MSIEQLVRQAAKKYPFPNPCCKAKRQRIEGLREMYIKRLIDSAAKDSAAVPIST